MPSKTYRTRQLADLRRYLASRAGTHLTVRDIRDGLAAAGDSIGRTTVYRLLERLVGEGCVVRHATGARAAACYEYTGPDECRGEPFHCYCESCGKLLHLHCPSWDRLKAHLSRAHRFRLDSVRTVFYGLCANCAHAR